MTGRAAKAALLALASVAMTIGASCTDEATSHAALGEPLRITGGQFVEGALPGIPLDADAGDLPSIPPAVTDLSAATRVFQPGQGGQSIGGHTSVDAQTVAVRFEGLGSGYWVVPVGGPDPSADGQLTWQLAADFAPDVTPGNHDLLFAAVNGARASGTQFRLPVCIDTPVPDNLNACDPTRVPPGAVLSLTWDSNVDLDLIVQTPGGKTVGGKQLTTAGATDGGAAPSVTTDPTASSVGVLDRDSNRNCVLDSIRRESVVWAKTAPSGTYQVWVDLASACAETSVRFTVSLWLPQGRGDGTSKLVEQKLQSGELLAAQANGGAAPGLFVGSFGLQ